MIDGIELITNTVGYIPGVRFRSASAPEEILTSITFVTEDILILRDASAGTAASSTNTSAVTPTVVDNGNGMFSIQLTDTDLNFTGSATVVLTPAAALEQRFRIHVAGATIRTSLTTIETDTDELQTDWADGGRLDNLLDGRMPTTHIAATDGKVNEVTLVATTTANSDMLSAEDIRDAVGLDNPNLLELLNDMPTVAQFNARTLVAADYLVAADLADLATTAQLNARTLAAADYATTTALTDLADYLTYDNIRDAIFNGVVEGDQTLVMITRVLFAAARGKASGFNDVDASNNITYFGLDGTTPRITATVDFLGNRTTVSSNGGT